MKAKTYDEWRELGYQVQRGEKATGRDRAGKATFTRDQVEERNEFQDDMDDDFYMDHPGNPFFYGSD